MSEKIVIIMGYLNRKEQLLQTFKSFEQYDNKTFDIHVIITDDMSNANNTLESIINDYPFKITLIKMLKKTWINPCVAYNTCINHIPQDTKYVIMQNPEIFHCGNILKEVIDKLQKNEYMTFSVYNSPNFEYNKLILKKFNEYQKTRDKKIFYKLFNDKKYDSKNRVAWYNHPIHRPNNYHFLSAIHYEDLKKIGGFNNEFKDGLWYDDDEIITRIKKIFKVNCNFNWRRLGCHLYHDSYYKENDKNKILKKKNKQLSIKYANNDIVYCDPKIKVECEIFKNNENKILYNNKTLNKIYDNDFSIILVNTNNDNNLIKNLEHFNTLYSNYNLFDVIVIDCANIPINIKNYNYKIDVIQFEKDKNIYEGINLGFGKCNAEIAILQFSEVYHHVNIFDYIKKNLTPRDYMIFTENNDCSAVYKTNLDIIGGFDKRFFNGKGYEKEALMLSFKYNLQLNIIDNSEKNICLHFNKPEPII